MSRDQLPDLAPIESIEQLLEYLHAGAKTPESRGIGTEHEKFIFRGPDCSLIEFDGEGGIEDLFGRLTETTEWEPELDRGRIVALVRGDEAITLEPGGQVELSGGVKKTIFETEAEFDRHIAELAAVCGDEYSAAMFGLNPWDGLDATGWVPKSRYDIMRRYLGGQGDLAHWMMKGTCTIQANLDYVSEEDAVDLVRTSVLLSPFVNALFANSPLRLGEPTGMQSFRAQIWTRTDPDRTGVPEFLLRDDWGFREWVEWVLDVPMFFIRRDGAYVDLAGHSFRDFMRDGYAGTPATMGDFELHLSTVFPDVRMKQFVEIRSADGGPREHVFALSALFKGLAYSTSHRRAARELIGSLSPEEHRELTATAARDGIHAEWEGAPILDTLAELLRLAGDALDELAEVEDHPSERRYLQPLTEIVEQKQSAADVLLAQFESLCGDRAPILADRNLFEGVRQSGRSETGTS